MPLYDHFRPPVFKRHGWPSFHAQWSVGLAGYLNKLLPERYLAEVDIHLGRQAAGDVVEFDTDDAGAGQIGHESGGNGVAVAAEPAVYAPPGVTTTLGVEFPDVVEVKVLDQEWVRRVVAVIELVSPANKDRPDEREAFAYKSLAYLKTGAGLVVADIVTTMDFNLHDELVRVGRSGGDGLPGSPATYVAAYRPVRRKKVSVLDVWLRPLEVGGPLPTVPLAVKGYGCVPLDLAATYAEACERSRIP